MVFRHAARHANCDPVIRIRSEKGRIAFDDGLADLFQFLWRYADFDVEIPKRTKETGDVRLKLEGRAVERPRHVVSGVAANEAAIPEGNPHF